MSSLWHSTRTSLDDSVTVLGRSFEQLKAAKTIDITEVVEQLKVAAESGRNLRALISSEAPSAAWKNRDELDALLKEIEKKVEARAVEEQRARLMSLAAELERGTVVHRRAVRVTQLNQLRDQAITELRANAAIQGAPPTLPGPAEVDEWIDWACNLQEPQDTEHLQTLRTRFAHLDEFIANMEPNMWSTSKEAAVL
jgi:hypothetical protein